MNLYKQFFESSPDGLLVVGRDGIIAEANTQAEALFGHARAELCGQRVELLTTRDGTEAPLVISLPEAKNLEPAA